MPGENALELRIDELRATGGRLDIALALSELDPEIPERRAAKFEQGELCHIEDMLRSAPEWMWTRLLAPDPFEAPYYRFLREAA